MEMFHAYQSSADKNILRQCELSLHIQKLKQKSKLITLTVIVVVLLIISLKMIKNASVVRMVWHLRNPASHSCPGECLGHPCWWPGMWDLCPWCLSMQGSPVLFLVDPLTLSSPTFPSFPAQTSGLTRVRIMNIDFILGWIKWTCGSRFWNNQELLISAFFLPDLLVS